MGDVEELNVWILPSRGPAIHQSVRGLSAFYVLGYDDDDPTIVRFVAPLRFKGITLFPSYWTTRPISIASPRVRIAASAALHRVRRLWDGMGRTCEAFIGFGDREADRGDYVFSGERLGNYKPDLELGPLELPCDAVGGHARAIPPGVEGMEHSEQDWHNRLVLAPRRDEDGSEHYEDIEFDFRAKPHEPSDNVRSGVGVRGTARGAQLMAAYSAKLLEQRGKSMKVRLALGHPSGTRYEIVIEGWVPPGAFELTEAHPPSMPEFGHYGGGGRIGAPPSYCLGTLEPGTLIFPPEGDAWAVVTERLEGLFRPGKTRHQLVNFQGQYKDAFCERRRSNESREPFRACIRGAEVLSNDVALRCPESAPPAGEEWRTRRGSSGFRPYPERR
jgi:hypothetical protein